MKVVINKEDRINYILDGVAEFYNISKEEVGRRARNPDKRKRKAIAIKLLIDVADCRLEDVCNAFGRTSKQAVSFIYTNFNDDIQSYKGKDLKREYEEVKKHLGI
jgi:chromosomal replication initiation ATPase DnaA